MNELPDYFITVKGTYFRGEEVVAFVKTLTEGDEVTLVPEPTNAYDPNAIKVMFKDVHIGYVDAVEASYLSTILNETTYKGSFVRFENRYPVFKLIEQK